MGKEIPAPAAEVWRVLGEGFGDLAWSSDITSSSLDGQLEAGAVRTCRFPPNMFSKEGVVRERLLTFDRAQMELSYEANDLPGFMPRAINRWSITPLDAHRCRIESRATVELRGVAAVFSPLMRIMLRRMGTKFIAELAARVETVRGSAGGQAAKEGVPNVV